MSSGVVSKTVTGTFALESTPKPSRQVILLGIALLLIQTLDALYTMVGIEHRGIGIEANGLMHHLMERFDPYQVLLWTKIPAIGVVIVLTLLTDRVVWLAPVMGFVCGVYLGAAIIPWTFVTIGFLF